MLIIEKIRKYGQAKRKKKILNLLYREIITANTLVYVLQIVCV